MSPIFDFLSFLDMVRGALDLPEIKDQATAWLNEKGAEYPDLDERAKALATWLGTTIDEANVGLDPATMRATLLGIANDVVKGQAGVDPGAWQGSI
jgi:hypothetical protein